MIVTRSTHTLVMLNIIASTGEISRKTKLGVPEKIGSEVVRGGVLSEEAASLFPTV